jgi:hypothetical protein
LKKNDESVPIVEERFEDLNNESVQAVGHEDAPNGENKSYIGLEFCTPDET